MQQWGCKGKCISLKIRGSQKLLIQIIYFHRKITEVWIHSYFWTTGYTTCCFNEFQTETIFVSVFQKFWKLCGSVKIFLNLRKIFIHLFLKKEFKQQAAYKTVEKNVLINVITCNNFWVLEKSFKKTFPYRFEFVILLYQSARSENTST